MSVHVASSPTRPRFARLVGLVSAVVLTLSACASPATENEPDATAAGTGAPIPAAMAADEFADTELDALFASEELEEYLNQQLQWEACEDDDELECATVTAPIDYEDVGLGEVDIAMARTSGEADFYLFTNPGGPGSSGIDFISWAASGIFSNELNETYNIISFDPRGVQRTSPVSCLSDEELDTYRAAPLVNAHELDWDAALARSQELIDNCQQDMGPVMGHLDTHTAALDMELMRRVLDAGELNYLGYSYGTALGARYAEGFPHRVGAMVLDGALDPSLEGERVGIEQMEGFLSATRDWANYCLTDAADSCPFTGTVDDVLDALHDRLVQLDALPLAYDGRSINGVTWMDGFIVPLYDHQTWDILVTALDMDLNSNDVSAMVALADLNYDRNDDGTYASNVGQAFRAINCADYGGFENQEQLIEQYDTVTESSPLFGRYFTSTSLDCNVWPNAAKHEPTEVNAAGTPPILVIGTTGDPATPYQWSESLAEQLEAGVLLTYEGFGHTAFGDKSTCVDAAVDGFFIDGQVPDSGTVCQ